VLLDSEDPRVLMYTMVAVARVGPDAAPTVSRLIEIVGDEKFPYRHVAIGTLGSLGAEAAPAIPTLRTMIQDKQHGLIVATMNALVDIGSAAAPTITAFLVDAQQDPDTRRTAALALQEMGKDARSFIPSLAKAAADPQDPLADDIYLTLSAIGAEALDSLVALLGSDIHENRRRAAMALGRMGPGAAAAEDALRKALDDEKASVRFWAAKTLADIGQRSQATTTCLIEATRDDDADVRWQAARALGKVGVGQAAEQALAALSNDPSPAVRAQAEASLDALQRAP
jgi:HEAT repeat protein